MPKDAPFLVRLDERDRERLTRLAAHHEITMAATIRLLIKTAAEALGPAAKPAKKSPRK